MSVKNIDNTDLRGKGKFSGSPRLAKEWAAITPEEKHAYRDMEITSKVKNKKRKMNADQIDKKTIRCEQYHDVMNGFEKSMAAMVENFNTHIILMAATYSRSTYLFPPYIWPSSSK